MARVPSMTVVVRAFQLETVTATETNLTPLTSAADHVRQTRTAMTSAMMLILAWVPKMSAGFAMVREMSTSAGAMKFRPVTVTAMAPNTMRLASAEGHVLLISMAMASAMM